MVPRINQASIIPVVDPVRVVGLLDVLVHGVVRQVPEGRPLCGRLPFQSVYPAIERAVGQVVVDGGLRRSWMIDGRIIGKTANSSRGSHQRRCRIHAGDSRELNSATGTSGERHPLELSWLRWELVGDPVVGMCKAQETELPERDSCWQQAKFLAAMCQNVSSRHEEICLSPSSRLTFKSTACQAALTRRFNLHQRKPREFPLVFNCGLVWPRCQPDGCLTLETGRAGI